MPLKIKMKNYLFLLILGNYCWGCAHNYGQLTIMSPKLPHKLTEIFGNSPS